MFAYLGHVNVTLHNFNELLPFVVLIPIETKKGFEG